MTPVTDRPTRFVARWDLDKTYLRTEFDTARDLLRTAFERADQKREVPGASAVLRELGESGAFIHILSGSPRQMRGRLEEKLRLDRVRWDELTLKPNLSNFFRLRLRALRDQLGYKLAALLQARRRLTTGATTPPSVAEVLAGDDAEADAFIYSLFADVCEGRVGLDDLRRILRKGRVYGDQAETCLEAAGALARGPTSHRILIHLDRQTSPSRFETYGARLVPFYNYLQAAFVLAGDRHLAPEAVLRVATEFVLRHRFDASALSRSYGDLQKRGHVAEALGASLERALPSVAGPATQGAEPALVEMCKAIIRQDADPHDPREPRATELDYEELAARHRGGRGRTERRLY